MSGGQPERVGLGDEETSMHFVEVAAQETGA